MEYGLLSAEEIEERMYEKEAEKGEVFLPFNPPIGVEDLKNAGIPFEKIGKQARVKRHGPDAETARIMGVSAFTTPIYTHAPLKVKLKKTVRARSGKIIFKKGKEYWVYYRSIDSARGIGYWAIHCEEEV